MPISSAAALGVLAGVPTLFHSIQNRLGRSLFAATILAIFLGNIGDVFSADRGRDPMNIYPGFLSVLCVAFAALAVVWWLGKGIDDWLDHPWGVSTSERTFSRLTLGNTAVAVLTALIYTQGRTVVFAVFPLLLLLRRRPGRSPVAPLTPKRLVHLALALLGLVAVAYFRQVDPLSGSEFPVTRDDGSYGRHVRHILQTGVESTDLQALPGTITSMEPYHYGDLWHAAFFTQVFAVNSVLAYVLFSPSLLWLNIVAGGSAIVWRVGRSKKTEGLAWGSLALLASGISWVPHLDLPLIRGDWWNVAPLLLTKMDFVAVWAAGAFLLWLGDRPLASTGSLVIASLLYLVVAPGVAIALPILLALAWRRGLVGIGDLRRLAPFGVGVAGWLLYLYSGQGGGPESAALREYYGTIEAPLRGARVLASILATSLLSYAPLWAIWRWIHYQRPDERFPGLSFLLVLQGGALLSYAVLHPRFNSVQHWSILYVALAPLALSALFARYWEVLPPSGAKRGVFIGLCLWLLLQNWPGRKGPALDVVEMRRTQYAVADFATPGTIGFIRDPSEVVTAFDRYVALNIPLAELLLVADTYDPICLSVGDIPEGTSALYRAYESDRNGRAPMGTFVTQLKRAGKYRDYPQAQADFVRSSKIRWVLLSPLATMPPTLWPLVEGSPSFVSREGWRWHRVLRP